MKKIPCILLVDDDETTNYLNYRMLDRSGIVDETLIALNGKEALEIIKNRFVDAEEHKGTSNVPMLVLLDINMPIMNGLEFIELFDALDNTIKAKVTIIVLTTSTHPVDLEKMYQIGVQHFISKPLQRNELEKLFALTNLPLHN